ncbi:MAG TPA: outer membrane lipoprotein carrier protein LolA [Rickettsiales bacterium]|nr:outer membrane lipoprotein carrier protein LolA [Rickettsiales bacterium]
MRFLLSLFVVLFISQQAVAEGVKPYKLSSDDRAALSRIEAYLSSVHTISSDFIQAAPNGDISTGKFFLQRPGKLRMEYLPPTPVLMVTSGGQIVYYDKELDQVTRIPLESTLVGFLARDNVKFDNTVIITDFERGDETISISLVQAKRQKDGSLTLEFSDSPLALRRMVVKDSGGQITTVSLNNARFNFPLPSNMFVFKDPHLGKVGGIHRN